jgi:hypothetical protein
VRNVELNVNLGEPLDRVREDEIVLTVDLAVPDVYGDLPGAPARAPFNTTNTASLEVSRRSSDR